jgi:lactoylglutathione lyase
VGFPLDPSQTPANGPRQRLPGSKTMPPPVIGTDPEQPKATVGWKLNHICFRIRDPEATTRFYRDILGMRTIFTVDAGSFSILYFGYPEVVGEHETGQEMIERRHNREGLIEFIHLKVRTPLPHPCTLLFGSSVLRLTQKNGPELTTRNVASNGFSHMGITVPDYDAALKRLKDAGVKILKDRGEEITLDVYGLPEDTPMPLDAGFVNVIRDIAFVEDPDGYCIEVMGQH